MIIGSWILLAQVKLEIAADGRLVKVPVLVQPDSDLVFSWHECDP